MEITRRRRKRSAVVRDGSDKAGVSGARESGDDSWQAYATDQVLKLMSIEGKVQSSSGLNVGWLFGKRYIGVRH